MLTPKTKMKSEFKKRVKRLSRYFLILFLILFILRLIYGYTETINNNNLNTQFFESISSVKRNYASKKYKMESSNTAQSPIKVDQKYEKIAEISSKSNEFDDEEKQAREQVDKYKALIQFEQKSGNRGYRKLNLRIGVPPENFDNLYNDLITIGKVQAKQITKKDKTNEYKELNAKRISLQKIKNSLLELKSKGGKIEEHVLLENRILEIEQQLQELGVNLGDFDDENEFCTVQFSLIEGKESRISFIHRVKVALEWTIKFYLRIMAALFFMVFFVYLLLLVIDKLKIIERIIK